MSTKTTFQQIKMERTKITDVEDSSHILEINQLDFVTFQQKIKHLKKSTPNTNTNKQIQNRILVLDLSIWQRSDITSKNYHNLQSLFNSKKIKEILSKNKYFTQISFIAPELWQKLLLESIIFWWKMKTEYEIVDNINKITV
tara:strand:- start:266 stop:691 length:426 start_codon:yes stop_codon:yes gene_type:complete